MSPSSLKRIRRQYRGLADSAHKQIGLRRLREAEQYQNRADMQDHVNALLAEAAYSLPYAQETDRRRRDRD